MVFDKNLLVDVLSFDLQLFLTGFANPVVFSFDEGVVVDTVSVIFGAKITLHRTAFYRNSGSCFSAAGPRTTTSTRRLEARPSEVLLGAMG